MKFSLLVFLLLSGHVWAGWSVSTYNIRNFDRDPSAGATNIAELERTLKEVKSDVMAFNEIVNVPAFKAVVNRVLPGFVIKHSTCGGMGKQNLALAYNSTVFDFISSKEDLSLSGNTEACASLRPLFLVTLKNKKTAKNFTFGLVHLKAGGDERAFAQRWSQYKKLENISKTMAKENLILLGDFNTTGYNIKNKDYEKFEAFLGSSQMRTVADEIGCTNYWDGADNKPEYLPSILDHIVVRDAQRAEVQSISVGAHCQKLDCRSALAFDLGETYKSVSDHCPVQVTFR